MYRIRNLDEVRFVPRVLYKQFESPIGSVQSGEKIIRAFKVKRITRSRVRENWTRQREKPEIEVGAVN